MNDVYTTADMVAMRAQAKISGDDSKLRMVLATSAECPWCEITFMSNAEYVDVGVGGRGVQVTGNECPECGAREMGQLDTTGLEMKDGWAKRPVDA